MSFSATKNLVSHSDSAEPSLPLAPERGAEALQRGDEDGDEDGDVSGFDLLHGARVQVGQCGMGFPARDPKRSQPGKAVSHFLRQSARGALAAQVGAPH